GQGDDWSFDTQWESQGQITPRGYAVRMAIPFRSLRFRPESMQTWAFAVQRKMTGLNEFAHWPHLTQKLSGFVLQFGELEGLEQISPGRNLQLNPYASLAGTHFLDQPTTGSPSFRGEDEFRGGIDAKAILHDSLTLDVTVNPDFSQVETDDPRVTVNQRFEVFFPEKRPFFLENASYFQTSETLFFSRRIGNPAFGARLTGRIGKWLLGALLTDDRAPGKVVEPTDPAYLRRASNVVARVQRDFRQQSYIGLMITDREFAGSRNYVGSIDLRWKLGNN